MHARPMRPAPFDLVVLSLRARGTSVSEIARRTGLAPVEVLAALARVRSVARGRSSSRYSQPALGS